jgi:hypothetical protein
MSHLINVCRNICDGSTTITQLRFLGVQGPHHVITVECVGTFPLDRGHIHTAKEIMREQV